MDPIESVRHFFVLLFWYVRERNWTVQSTSTIVKPRKEPDEYKVGDLVVAKFRGRPYRAVVVRVEDEKEKLDADKIKFDGFLQDYSLSPSQLLTKMGVDASLDITDDDMPKPLQPEASSRSDKAQKAETSNRTPQGSPNLPRKKSKQSDKTSAKSEEKQRREAALESSKLMAARIFQNKAPSTHTDKATNKPAQKLTQPDTNPQIAQNTTQLNMQLQNHSSSGTHSMMQTANYSSDYTQPQYPAASMKIHANQMVNSQIAEPLPQNCFTTFNTDNSYDYYGNYNYSNSASEFLASSITSTPKNASPTLDCSKCQTHINALEQRIKSLEEKVEVLTSAWSTWQSVQTPQHQSTLNTQQVFQTPVQSTNKMGQSLENPCTSMSATEFNSEDAVISEDGNTEYEVELVPGYAGVRISIPQLDVCLRKARGSGTALARLLCGVFFSDDILSRSSARGTKEKPALDKQTIDAIIKYVEQKRKCPEKDIIQAINQKCADARVALKPVKKK